MTGKRWMKIYKRRIARRRGFTKVFRSFRKLVAGYKKDEALD